MEVRVRGTIKGDGNQRHSWRAGHDYSEPDIGGKLGPEFRRQDLKIIIKSVGRASNWGTKYWRRNHVGLVAGGGPNKTFE